MIRPNPFAQFMDSSRLTTPATHTTESSHPLVAMTGLASNCHDNLEQLALSMSSGGHSGMENHVISCHAFVAPSDSLCIRVNTTDSYKEVNKLVRLFPVMYCLSHFLIDATPCVKFMPQWSIYTTATTNKGTWHGKPHPYLLKNIRSTCAQVTLDSLVGQYVSMKEKVSIKHSMVHNHSLIGEKSRLLLSVIMDHVKIGDKWEIV